MNKIIALAVASAFIVPSVMADVTVYGSLRTAVEGSKQTDAQGNTLSQVRLVDENSRLGFKGSDKLDSGITLIWTAESVVKTGSNAPSYDTVGWNGRDTFIGLSGNFGLIRAGTRFCNVTCDALADFADSLGDSSFTSDASEALDRVIRRGNNRPTNQVYYTSPSFNGLQFKADYDFGAHTATANGFSYAASVFYKNNMFDIGTAYNHSTNTNQSSVNANTTSTLSAPPVSGQAYNNYIVAGQWKPIANLKIGAGWQRVETTTPTASTKATAHQDGYGIGGTYVDGKFTYQLVAGKVGNVNGDVANSSDTGYAVANGTVTYALSKQSKAVFGMGYIKNQARANTYSSLGFGLATTDTGLGLAPQGGGSTKLVSVGLRTDF